MTFKPAGFWVRLAALLIDGALLFVGGFIIGFASGFTGAVMGIAREDFSPYIPQAIGILLAVAYTTLLLASPWQATPGKRLLKIFVVNATTGGRLTIGHSFARFMLASGLALAVNLMVTHIEHKHAQRFTAEEKVQIQTLAQQPPETWNPDQRLLMADAQNAPGNYAIVGLGLLMILYTLASLIFLLATREKTALHDIICKTRAVRGLPETAYTH